MKKVIFFIMLIILPSGVFGNKLNLPNLPAIDYFRGTAGESLFFNNQKLQKGTFYIDNDFRIYNSNKYWGKSGKNFDSDKYTRFINIISIKYSPISKTQFSIRVPYVYINNESYSNYGLSDIFFGVSYEIAQFSNSKIYLSSGVKIPVGYYEYIIRKLPLGTGGFDIPFIINSDFGVKNLLLFLDIGYIFIGGNEISYNVLIPPYDNPTIGIEKAKINNGDEIFGDIAIIKELNWAAVKFEMNYYYIFDSSSLEPGFLNRSWNHSHYKFSITPGLIFSPKFKNIKLELGFSYDLIGKNNLSGYSPVIRIHFNN